MSAVDVFQKANSIKSEDIVNGSLFFKDFHKGEIPSLEQFQKLQLTTERFNKVANRRFAEEVDLATVKGEVTSIKGELGAFVKSADADARYLKVSDPVVHGDGSVFSETVLITELNKRVPFMAVPNLITLEAENGKPRLVWVTNQTGGPLNHTRCGEGASETKSGVVQPGKFFHCPITDVPLTIQLFGEGPNPTVATLTVSAVGNLGESGQYTAQLLIGT